jgi:hypothetical protein
LETDVPFEAASGMSDRFGGDGKNQPESTGRTYERAGVKQECRVRQQRRLGQEAEKGRIRIRQTK